MRDEVRSHASGIFLKEYAPAIVANSLYYTVEYLYQEVFNQGALSQVHRFHKTSGTFSGEERETKSKKTDSGSYPRNEETKLAETLKRLSDI